MNFVSVCYALFWFQLTSLVLAASLLPLCPDGILNSIRVQEYILS